MTPDQIHKQTTRIADELQHASDVLACAHYLVQDLNHNLELPTPAILDALAELSQATDTVSLHFRWVAETPRPAAKPAPASRVRSVKVR